MSARERTRVPKIAWVAIVLVTVAALVWITLLPMRQTEFRVLEHELVRNGSAIEGRLSRNGEAVTDVVVEAYLYDDENRYLGTVWTAVPEIAADGEADFRIPLESREADRIARYSLYAGTKPNPFAPDR